MLLSAPYGTEKDAELLKKFYPFGLRSASFVVIETDDGISGLGECYSGVFVPELTVMLMEMIGKHLVGCDPLDVEKLKGMMTRFTSYWGYGGFAKNVISAFEIALWDIKGKHLRQPVFELLGGAKVDQIELYASGGLGKEDDDLAEELSEYAAAGFHAVKIRDRDLKLTPVETSRKAIGENVKLIVDTNQSFSPDPRKFDDALAYSHKIAEYDVWFLEEPLGVDDFEGYQKLVAASAQPISGGETLNSAAIFRRHIFERAFDIVQPDASVIGGIGECLEVLTTASDHGLRGVCHCFGAAPAQAANVHAAFAAGCSLIEWATPPNPLRDVMRTETPVIVDGFLQKPTAHGLGIELTPEIEREFKFVSGTNNPGNFK